VAANNPENNQKKTGTTMIVAMWVLLLVMLAYFFDGLLDKQNNPNQALTTRYINDIREVELQRNRYGHYVTNGRINGQAVVFILDTGATGVAVPEHIAQKLKLERGQRIRIHTANGVASAYTARLKRVSIGEIELEEVSALVNPNDKADEVLLGMSFLKHIEFTQRGDKLILRQYLQ